MKYEDFKKLVWSHMGQYKKEVLKVNEDVKISGHIYEHILPEEKKDLNFEKIKNCFNRDGNILTLLDYGKEIKLHTHWNHLNSSQVLCITYFYPFINNTEKLNALLSYLGINEKAEKGHFEVVAGKEKTNVDFAIELANKKYVYFEIKYTEPDFGKISSTTSTSVYNDYFKEHSKTAKIDRDSYDKYYQLVRNVCLSSDGNYTVFLLPRVNESININYENGMRKIGNFSKLRNSVKRVMWEDLLLAFPDEEFFEKYFSFMR